MGICMWRGKIERGTFLCAVDHKPDPHNQDPSQHLDTIVTRPSAGGTSVAVRCSSQGRRGQGASTSRIHGLIYTQRFGSPGSASGLVCKGDSAVGAVCSMVGGYYRRHHHRCWQLQLLLALGLRNMVNCGRCHGPCDGSHHLTVGLRTLLPFLDKTKLKDRRGSLGIVCGPRIQMWDPSGLPQAYPCPTCSLRTVPGGALLLSLPILSRKHLQQ